MRLKNLNLYMKSKKEAKKESFESGVNKLQYLPGAEVFLRQQRYLSFENVEESNDEVNNQWA